jgi:hypothetical protein
MREITEKYLMQVTKHIFVEIFARVNLGFLLSFCTNSSSFVFNHLSISAFIGFHGLNIPFYTFILHTFLPRIRPLNLCSSSRQQNHLLVFSLLLLLGLTQVRISTGFQQNPKKLSALLVHQKATLHTGCTTISPEIDFMGDCNTQVFAV